MPAFAPTYRVEVVSGEAAFLLSERRHVILQGPIYCDLAPYLDGQFSVEEIIARLSESLTAAEIYYALDRLQQAGYLVDGSCERTERSTFWSGLGLDSTTTERQLRTGSVRLAAFGGVDLAPLEAALTGLGIRVAEEHADLIVAVSDDYLHDGLAETNAEALASGRPWLLLKPTGSILWFGPLFRPGHTACWECLAQRLRGHREVEAFLQSVRPCAAQAATMSGRAAPGADVALDLAVLEVAKALATDSDTVNRMLDAVVTLDRHTLTTVRHTLIRRPTCPS